MRIVGLGILQSFGTQHANVQRQIGAWCAEVQEAQWQCPVDVKKRYSSASFLSGNRIVFNIKGNNYRLEVKVCYEKQLVLVKRIGTHAEYSKWQFP